MIGQRAEAAIEQVDKMLDSAALAQVERVRIVHGHGMGILKKRDRGDAEDQSARREILFRDAGTRRLGRDHRGTEVTWT